MAILILFPKCDKGCGVSEKERKHKIQQTINRQQNTDYHHYSNTAIIREITSIHKWEGIQLAVQSIFKYFKDGVNGQITLISWHRFKQQTRSTTTVGIKHIFYSFKFFWEENPLKSEDTTSRSSIQRERENESETLRVGWSQSNTQNKKRWSSFSISFQHNTQRTSRLHTFIT